jgi:hypothetical protein
VTRRTPVIKNYFDKIFKKPASRNRLRAPQARSAARGLRSLLLLLDELTLDSDLDVLADDNLPSRIMLKLSPPCFLEVTLQNMDGAPTPTAVLQAGGLRSMGSFVVVTIEGGGG